MEQISEIEQRISNILNEYGYIFVKSEIVSDGIVKTTYDSGEYIYQTLDIEK